VYITRQDNPVCRKHNHAVSTNSELIVVFDADFVPTKKFSHPHGSFFQDEKSSPCSNSKAFITSTPLLVTGLGKCANAGRRVHRQIQPLRDSAGSVVCSGTSFVLRQKRLKAVGVLSLIPSVKTIYGIRISALGYRLVYLDEKLSAGLAAENIAAHAPAIAMGKRNHKHFFKSNPLTIPGRPLQG